MNKQAVTFFLAIVVGLFSGCGSVEDPTDGSEDSTQEAQHAVQHVPGSDDCPTPSPTGGGSPVTRHACTSTSWIVGLTSNDVSRCDLGPSPLGMAISIFVSNNGVYVLQYQFKTGSFATEEEARNEALNKNPGNYDYSLCERSDSQGRGRSMTGLQPKSVNCYGAQ